MATFIYPPVQISTAGLATEATLSAINAKINDDYGPSSGAVRTAAQIGNSSGVAAFGAGTTSAQTLRVVLPTDQSAIPASQSGTWNINNISGTISLPTGASTAVNQATEIASLSSIDGKLNSLGQKTMAASVPVVIASNQSAVAISAASLPLPTGAATEVTLASIKTDADALNLRLDGGLVPFSFDYQAITYVGVTTDISTVTYKSGGAGGTTVATLTMGYDGSSRLTSVTRT